MHLVCDGVVEKIIIARQHGRPGAPPISISVVWGVWLNARFQVISTRRSRPVPSPTRAMSQRESALAGCQRRHSQASSTITVRRWRLPALLMPCSRDIPPLAQGVPVSPA